MVLGGQPAQVALQVRLHLGFGLHHKAQADPVTESPGQQPQAKCPRVPHRVEQRGPRAQFVQALCRPGQVVGFLSAGVHEMGAQCSVFGCKSLRRVERLGADFAYVVDPHQRAGLRLFRCRQFAVHLRERRAGSGCTRLGEQGTQGCICGNDQVVHASHFRVGGRPRV